MAPTDSTDTAITRDDIEAKLRQITEPAGASLDSARSTAKIVVVGVVVVVVVGAFLLGRRRGKRSNRTVVEVVRL